MSNKRIILLTGAGFTKNFGGFLGIEIWDKILYHENIQNCPWIKNKMLGSEDFNYESLYTSIINSPLSGDANNVNAIDSAVKDAYDLQNKMVLSDSCKNNSVIGRFSDFIVNNVSCFFTLNQDLFIEKHILEKSKIATHYYLPHMWH